jgi:hypothetical protein
MTTSRALLLTGFLAAVSAAAGCGEDIPANPTWADDVRPLMVARCIRCHQTNPVGDPGGGVATGDFDFESISDFDAADLALSRESGDQARMGYMPPAPAARLADWQIEILERWSSHQQ